MFAFLMLLLCPSAQAQSVMLLMGSSGGRVSTPTDSPGVGTYTSTQTVTLSTTTPGATILYTTTGTAPSCPSTGTTYSTGFSVSSTTTVKAIGCKSGLTDSAVLTSVYTITASTAFVNSACAGGTTGATTAATDMTGANFFVFSVTRNTSSVAGTAISDSINTTGYVNLVTDTGGAGPFSFLSYRENASSSSTQTFTVSAAGEFIGFCVLGFSGVVTSSSLQSGTNLANHSFGATVAPGSITPGAGKNLIISSIGDGDTGTWTIDGGFSTPVILPKGPGVYYAAGISYLIQAGSTAVNPIWSVASAPVATIAAFTGN
jgi:hypothetical protein